MSQSHDSRSTPGSADDDIAHHLFRDAHLPTSVDWAVFIVMSSLGDESLTAAEVARDARASHHEADQALRRFAAAGIVERIDEAGRPRRYRLHEEMAYLATGQERTGTLDPVCGMPISEDSPHVIDDGEERVVFCSLPCLVRWRHRHRHPRR